MKAEKPETLTVEEALVALQAELNDPAALQSEPMAQAAERSYLNPTLGIRGDQEQVHFMVWEVELGARIYQVPHGKLDSLHRQPHADRFKVFDDLATAKLEAFAVFKKVSEKRADKMLPPSILEPILADIKRWREPDVPSYFL